MFLILFLVTFLIYISNCLSVQTFCLNYIKEKKKNTSLLMIFIIYGLILLIYFWGFSLFIKLFLSDFCLFSVLLC